MYATSSAVSGSPSLHVTPWRMLIVHVSPSADTLRSVTSLGEARRGAQVVLVEVQVVTSQQLVLGRLDRLPRVQGAHVVRAPSMKVTSLAGLTCRSPVWRLAEAVPAASITVATAGCPPYPWSSCCASLIGARCHLTVLRTGRNSRLVDRERPGVGVQGGGDPQGIDARCFPCPRGSLLSTGTPRRPGIAQNVLEGSVPGRSRALRHPQSFISPITTPAMPSSLPASRS